MQYIYTFVARRCPRISDFLCSGVCNARDIARGTYPSGPLERPVPFFLSPPPVPRSSAMHPRDTSEPRGCDCVHETPIHRLAVPFSFVPVSRVPSLLYSQRRLSRTKTHVHTRPHAHTRAYTRTRIHRTRSHARGAHRVRSGE